MNTRSQSQLVHPEIARAEDRPDLTYLAAIEIAEAPSSRFLESIYQLSANGQIALLLRSVSPSSINRILDPIVPNYPIFIPGLRYQDARSDSEVSFAIAHAQWIWVCSRHLRDLILTRGLAARCLPLSCWEHRLPLMSLDHRARGARDLS